MDTNTNNINTIDVDEPKNPIMKFIKTKILRKPSLLERRAMAGYAFVLPFILGVLLIYIPILVDSIWFSFNEITPTATGLELTPVGFKYYKEAFENSSFTTALMSAIQNLLFEVPAIIVFSLFIAVVLNQKMLGRAAFRAIFFVPVIISAGLMETVNAKDTMSNMMEGGINDGTGSEGIMQVDDLKEIFADMGFGSEIVAFVVGLVNDIYNIINYSGVQMLIFLAALQGISPAIYEACTIDGATGWETFWKITFPMISPMILVNAAYTIIDSFTRESNVTMRFIFDNVGIEGEQAAMAWIYFGIAILVIALVAAIVSSFVFYQRRD